MLIKFPLMFLPSAVSIMLLIPSMQASNFSKSSTAPWVFSTFLNYTSDTDWRFIWKKLSHLKLTPYVLSRIEMIFHNFYLTRFREIFWNKILK